MFLNCVYLFYAGSWSLSQLILGKRRGYTTDRSPVHHNHSRSYSHLRPANLHVFGLWHPEGNHTHGENIHTYRKSWPGWNSNSDSGPSSYEATVLILFWDMSYFRTVLTEGFFKLIAQTLPVRDSSKELPVVSACGEQFKRVNKAFSDLNI